MVADIVGFLWPTSGIALKPLGAAFVSPLTVTLAPLVMCMVIVAVGAVSNRGSVGKVALLSMIYFDVLTSIALGLGLLSVNIIRPGAGLHAAVSSLE
jgi:aerobic C4-dicarboxylate transport protein